MSTALMIFASIFGALMFVLIVGGSLAGWMALWQISKDKEPRP